MINSTYHTAEDGIKIDAGGIVLADTWERIPTRYRVTTITGTQMQTGNTASLPVVVGQTGKCVVPVAWHVFYDNAGGTAYTVNTNLNLVTATDFNILGSATAAISGSADKFTTGSIVATGNPVVSDNLHVQVATGNPTGGDTAASFIVRVWYVLV